jgi:meiotically up-regulated gene 157 (Mug157) protein
LALPFQRPFKNCRTFTSSAVEKVIDDIFTRMRDPDLAHIFRNAFPNTLDTTVRWHVDGIKSNASQSKLVRDKGRWRGAQSFIVTGDINAEWLRDSTNQLAQYQALAKSTPEISNLILGAINTQAEFVIESPYCNAFQPPSPSRLNPVHSGQQDYVHPAYEPSHVFECKYELDSLANFLSLSNQYHASTGSTAFLTKRWYLALDTILTVLEQQSESTFNPETGSYRRNEYTFRRYAWTGTETLNLEGIGNPLANGTGLIRSAFRPSDDATIFGFFIPANAMMSVELARTAALLKSIAIGKNHNNGQLLDLAELLISRSERIKKGIYDHAIISHKIFGDVFAFEVDGYGSHLLMDDANIPSLLSLPLLGFLDNTDPIYQNTRRMLLSQPHNPYFLRGAAFHGIGGPHIGLRNAWPMSLLVQAMTSDDEEEIMECVNAVKNVSLMGLINESVDVQIGGKSVSRSWFAWANSVFAQTILHLAENRPGLIFKDDKPYKIGKDVS